jgi:hypothetical protein
MKTKTSLASVGTLLGLLLPILSFAQASIQAPSLESYQAKVGDQALAMLSAIFGSANGIFGGNPDASVNNMFLAFNVAVLSVGTAWFGYNMVTAIIQGSYDGEFLGKRYSSVWMPIRTVSGAAGLIPVWNGWNGAQLLMAFCASVGIGIGNITWAGLSGEIVPALVTRPAMHPISDLAQPILASRVCLANRWVDQARLRKANVDAGAEEYSVNWSSKPITGTNYAAITYGAQPAANGNSETSCGQVTVEFPKTDSTDPDVQAVISASRQAMAAALQQLDSDIEQLVAPAKDMDPDDPDAIKTLEKGIQAKLPRLVAARQVEMDTRIDAAVSARSAKVASRLDDLTRRYGWLAAGATPALISLNSMDVAKGTPNLKSEAPKTSGEPPTVQDNVYVGEDAVMGEMNGTLPPPTACGLSSIGKDFIYQCVERPLINKVKNAGVGSLVGVANKNPVLYSQALGLKILDMLRTLVSSYLLIIGAIAVIALAPGLGGVAAIVGPALNLFGILMALVVAPLALFAIQLIAYVPLMLTIAWIMAVCAWAVVVGESLVAATLWALVHLDPEGEGMGQKTTHGYIFTLNLLFRPAILVFAAFFAQRFCAVLGGFANDVMGAAIAKMMELHSTSLFLFLLMTGAGVWITTTLNIKIVGVSASLLNVIPNQIFTWLGGHFGSDVGAGIAETTADRASGGGDRLANSAAQLRPRNSSSGDGEKGGADKNGATQPSLGERLKNALSPKK